MQSTPSNGDILVGVSQTGDPAGAWFLYRFQTGALIDFPVVGFNKKWIVVAINRYSAGGAFQRGITLVQDYAQARVGVGTGTLFTQAVNSHFCSAPCVTYSAASDTEYVVTHLASAAANSPNGGQWSALPHLAGNAAGEFLVAFSQFSSAQHPGAGYAVHLAGDASGSLRDPFIYKAGDDYYHKTFTTSTGRNRWGDFSTAQVDPSDDQTFWTLQEYAKPRATTADSNTGSNASRWSTWWAALGPPPLPTVALGAGPSQAEGNTGTTAFRFPVSLSASSAQNVTVNYQTSNGTATAADNDYQPATSSIVISAGLTSDTIFVNVVGDTKSEANETFGVTLTGATNATLGAPASATGTILDDDALPALAIDDVSLAEGYSGTTAFTFTASLSAVSGPNVQVGYGTADGTATLADPDYAAASGPAPTPAGSVSTPIT